MNTPQFSIADKLTRSHEGQYANNPDDRGGETYCGISRKKWPRWQSWQYIDSCKKSSTEDSPFPGNINHVGLKSIVAHFYYINFWLPIRGSDLRHQLIANQLYDISVNGGTQRAAKYLQRTLNLLNRNGKDFGDIKVDGGIGDKTVGALRTFLRKRSCGIYILGFLLLVQMGSLWVRLATEHPEQEAFMNGWAKRGALNALEFAKHFLRITK